MAFQEKGQEMWPISSGKGDEEHVYRSGTAYLVLTGTQDKYDSDKYETNQPLPSSQAAPNYTTELNFLGR